MGADSLRSFLTTEWPIQFTWTEEQESIQLGELTRYIDVGIWKPILSDNYDYYDAFYEFFIFHLDYFEILYFK